MKKKLIVKTIITTFLFILLGYNSFFLHIIGADLHYECLGQDSTANSRSYKIYYNQYTDCDGFELGIDLYFGIWHSGTSDVVVLTQDTVHELENPNFPCLELPQGICVQERVYSGEIELMLSDSSYYIVFQKCCRTDGITNINPVDYWGATHYI